MVEWMSKGQDATASSHVNGKEIPPMIEVMEFSNDPSSEDLSVAVKRIRQILSSRRAVALSPKSHDPRYTWSEKTISYLISNFPGHDGWGQVISWQSQYTI